MKPGSGGPTWRELQRRTLRYAQRHRLAHRRVRDWVAYMAIVGALERQDMSDGEFVLKGGVALELRTPGLAHATQDLDLIVNREGAIPGDPVVAALAEPFGPFTFEVKDRRRELALARTTRLLVSVRYRGRDWSTASIDATAVEAHPLEVESIPGFPIEELFGVPGPDTIPCLSLRYHLAHKLHGVTRPGTAGWSNDRVHDLVDLLCLVRQATTLSGVRKACEEVFVARHTHAWPPAIALPARWEDEYAALAATVEGVAPTLTEATTTLRALLAQIDQS